MDELDNMVAGLAPVAQVGEEVPSEEDLLSFLETTPVETQDSLGQSATQDKNNLIDLLDTSPSPAIREPISQSEPSAASRVSAAEVEAIQTTIEKDVTGTLQKDSILEAFDEIEKESMQNKARDATLLAGNAEAEAKQVQERTDCSLTASQKALMSGFWAISAFGTRKAMVMFPPEKPRPKAFRSTSGCGPAPSRASAAATSGLMERGPAAQIKAKAKTWIRKRMRLGDGSYTTFPLSLRWW